MISTTIGLRAKTARAVAVILSGTARAPVAVRRIELIFATSQTPATFQPYHEVMDLPWERAQVQVRTAESKLVATAALALRQLVDEAKESGGRVRAVGIVGAPDRKLAAIGSPHIRAHAAEGVLFRRILERAASENGLEWQSYPEPALEDRAAQELAISASNIKEILSQFGRALGRPWRADEKSAALGAWLALARPGS
jgi:hypothetical protein